MNIVGWLVNLLILACALWILAMILDLIAKRMGLPAEVKPIVLALIGLIGLIAIFGGYRIVFI